MNGSLRYILLLLVAGIFGTARAQPAAPVFTVTVTNEKQQPFEHVIVEQLKAQGRERVRTVQTDAAGKAVFPIDAPGTYIFSARSIGYETQVTASLALPGTVGHAELSLKPLAKILDEVAVTGRKQVIQRVQGKTIVNVDAILTNAGTTVLEVLEKSPGVMVDRNGGISLQGKPNVLVMIDDKPTYLSGAELSNLLGSMNSAQVSQIELITNPSAKYDASGNAGIINIKTKKNLQQGLNGNLTTSFGQGRYYKNNNALNLNYRNGKFNSFLNYGANLNKGFTDIYALRNYFNASGQVISTLDQPTYLTSRGTSNQLKAGTDFYASEKLTLGMSLSGALVRRNGKGDATATWLNPAGAIDSAIGTYSNSAYRMQNEGINLNLRNRISKGQELAVDLDALSYTIGNDQGVTNRLLAAGGYTTGSSGDIPSTLRIFSGKADYSLQLGENKRLETGFKSSAINTDNIADYLRYDGSSWQQDPGKSNHFRYREYINSLYSSVDLKSGRLSMQAGLRYENTFYRGHQLGNSVRPDSAFSRNYSSLFPSGNMTWQVDSSHSFSFTAGRRIDRPAYQKLNPFVFIINKYTHEQGNPYFLPQYSWNMELGHSWKDVLITTLSYSTISNYFSQLFLSKGDDILVYTQGNVGRAHTLGVSLAAQLQFFSWWSLTGQSVFNYKKLSGYQDVAYSSSVNQLHTSLNNQFRISKTLTAELSGFYTTQARNDLQELLTPTGQVSAGLAKTLFKGMGSLRLTGRDVFYTQAMEGLTDFPGASEYFILWRDSQVISLGFSYRFGKQFKAAKRSPGSAADEINRAGS